MNDRDANARLEALSDGVFAKVTTMTWIVWLVMSLRAKHE